MADDQFFDLAIRDVWETFSAEFRGEFLARRVTSLSGGAPAVHRCTQRRWRALRPVVLEEHVYNSLELILDRLLHLAVEACRRRAATLGQLHRALRFPHELPLMDADRPLVASELIRYARPDILVERGRPWLLEFNNSTRLGGASVTPRLAQTYARLCPGAGLSVPPSTGVARSEALTRTLDRKIGSRDLPRLLIPTYWTISDTGAPHHHDKVKESVVADAQRAGFEVVQADLAELRLDAAGRLLVADGAIDVVLIHWGADARIVNDEGGLTALRLADQTRTVSLFPRTESVLISSKAVLAWLHEDCDAGILASADRDLVRHYIPQTACVGLDTGPTAREKSFLATHARHQLIAKPAVGKSGTGVVFGSDISERDWISATADGAHEAPVVLQHRIEPDRTMMQFLDQTSGRHASEPVPTVISPFMIDSAAASVAVRHPGPDVSGRDVVISVSHGARANAALLARYPRYP